ncbi:MAG: Ig-like domain-containing protein [Steroidobacteraceae bacterium]
MASLKITSAPQHGTVSVDATSGLITYKPVIGYVGTDSFQYTVRDSLTALSNVASVNITVQPTPVAVNETASVQANQNIAINVLANDTSAGGTLDATSIRIVVAPAHGVAVVTNGSVVYTPTAGYSGIDTFQYSMKDNLDMESNVATVFIEVTAAPSTGGGGGSGSSGGGGGMNFLFLVVLAGFALRPSSLKAKSAALIRR